MYSRSLFTRWAMLVWVLQLMPMAPAGNEGLEFPTQAKAGLNGALLHQGSIYAAAVFSRPVRSPAACAAAGALKAACKPDPSGVPFPVHGSQPLAAWKSPLLPSVMSWNPAAWTAC